MIPYLGSFAPNMGTPFAKVSSSVAGALFSSVQQRVLGLLFGSPARTFRTTEILEHVQGGVGAAHRQLVRLADAGLLVVTSVGNQKLYRANQASPVFAELHGLIVKTVGLVDPLREALVPLEREIVAAFVFGSMASGTERSNSDVDLMVVSDTLRYPDVIDVLQRAEAVLARPVNPTMFTVAGWHARRDNESFVSRVLEKQLIRVIGNPDDIE